MLNLEEKKKKERNVYDALGKIRTVATVRIVFQVVGVLVCVNVSRQRG